jgi:hypothetical protein
MAYIKVFNLLEAITHNMEVHTEKEWEGLALHRKMLIKSRKRFLEAYKNQLGKLLCS